MFFNLYSTKNENSIFGPPIGRRVGVIKDHLAPATSSSKISETLKTSLCVFRHCDSSFFPTKFVISFRYTRSFRKAEFFRSLKNPSTNNFDSARQFSRLKLGITHFFVEFSENARNFSKHRKSSFFTLSD